jgi:hypothetical protein
MNPDNINVQSKNEIQKLDSGVDNEGKKLKVGDIVYYGRRYVSEIGEIYDADDIYAYSNRYDISSFLHSKCDRFKFDYPNADYAYQIKGVKDRFFPERIVYKLERGEFATYDDATKLKSYKKIIDSGFIKDISSALLKKRGHFAFQWKLNDTKNYGWYVRLSSDYGRLFVRRNEIRRRDIDKISGNMLMQKFNYPILTLQDYDTAFKFVYQYIIKTMNFDSETEAELFKKKRNDWSKLKGLGII